MIYLLHAGAAIQVFVALLNLGLPRLLGWRPALAGLPLLVREVFYVHAFFVSLTLFGFAALTFAFAPDMAVGDRQANGIAAFIGVFWAIRVVVQLLFYSREHHRGKARETVIHWVLLAVYGGMAAVYVTAAWS